MSVGTKLSVSVISMFCLLAIIFIIFQVNREKEYKIEQLEIKLQDYNIRMNESIEDNNDFSENFIEKYITKHNFPNLRITIISKDGQVLYDNQYKDYALMGNHLKRKEIKEALTIGKGTEIVRKSSTLRLDYFYVASYFPNQKYIIRTALPYDQNLGQLLKINLKFVWFIILIVAILIFILYRFTHKLGKYISKLRVFVQKADNNDKLDTEDLLEFPNDELGEIAERIIKLYIQLQRTKDEQNRLKRQLTQNATHELKTPVASIQGYLETVLSDKNMREEDKQHFLERCFSQTQRLTSILNDISVLHNIEEMTDNYEFVEVDIAEIIRNIVEETEL